MHDQYEERRQTLARRAALQDEAAGIGIDEAYIALLVDSFYGRVQQDAVLGPIFDRAIDDWGPHLLRMKAFWSAVMLRTGRYGGQPMRAHMQLKGLEPAHFSRWLALFEQTLSDTAPTPEAAARFMETASRIGQSLQQGVFGVAGRLEQ